jgi:hypothetical protein
MSDFAQNITVSFVCPCGAKHTFTRPDQRIACERSRRYTLHVQPVIRSTPRAETIVWSALL